jgi:hypothetical protein
MANRYAIKNGNWSDPTVWDGGTLPTSSDVVRPNNYTIVIDQDINVQELRNDAASPAVANGSFTLVGDYTITIGTSIQCFASNLINYNGTGTAYITGANSTASIISSTTTNNTSTIVHSNKGHLIVDMVMNSTIAGENNRFYVNITGGGTFTSLKDIKKCQGVAGNTNSIGISVNTTVGAILNLKSLYAGNLSGGGQVLVIYTICTVNIVGNVYASNNNGGNAQGTIGLYSGNGGTINIIGDVVGTSVTMFGYAIQSQFGGIGMDVNINGNVSGAIQGAKITIIGNVFGSSNVITSLNNITIIGNITGCSSYGVATVVVSGIFNHIGTAIASATSAAIQSTNAQAIITCTGPFIKNGATLALNVASLRINSDYNPYFEFLKSDDSSVIYVPSSAVGDIPPTQDVRYGVSYNFGLSTGTCHVPTPDNVRKNIPVDNTVGTSDNLNAEDILEAIQNSSLPIAERLRNVATVESTGAQIAGYG